MFRRSFVFAFGAAALAACTRRPPAYDGPQVTMVVVQKAARQLHLMHNDTVLRSYPMQMGFAPEGHKRFEGDGKTPEGVYVIDRHNPSSRYYLSVGISYPNARDRAVAAAAGRSPGGDIFIHGTPRRFANRTDWTAGCIAVRNDHMREIFTAVRRGTPIAINP